MKNIKILVILGLLVGFLGACADNKEKPFSLVGTVWSVDRADPKTSEYMKLEFVEGKINSFFQKGCTTANPPVCTYPTQGYVKYEYKNEIFKITEDNFWLTVSGGVKVPGTGAKISPISDRFFILKLDGKDAVKDGFKITKDTKTLNLTYKFMGGSSEDFVLKRIK